MDDAMRLEPPPEIDGPDAERIVADGELADLKYAVAGLDAPVH